MFVTGPPYQTTLTSSLSPPLRWPPTHPHIHSVPNAWIDYLGVDGIQLQGARMPSEVLNTDDIHVCIFIEGDSVGCKPVKR